MESEDNMSIDKYFVTVDRPCGTCEGKGGDGLCRPCNGTGRIKDELQAAELVKLALKDLGATPPPCSECAQLRRELANLVQFLDRNATEEHDLSRLFLDRDGIGARIFKTENG